MRDAQPPVNRAFWRSAIVIMIAAGGMAVLARGATFIYRLPHGHLPGMLIGVVRSSASLENPGVTGYYERLFAANEKLGQNRIYDRSFLLYRFKPNLRWEHNLVTTNSFGLVGPECSLAKPPHTRRIALIGDSVTVGHMVRQESIYPTLLENRLNAEHAAGSTQRIEILNFASIAYTLPQFMDVSIEEAPRFQPDAYILALTELAIFRQWDRHLVDLIHAGIDLKYDFLRDVARKAEVSQSDDSTTLFAKLAPYRIPVIRETLRLMKDNASRHGARFIVLLLSGPEDGDLTAKRMEGIPEILASLDIPVVDVLDTFRGILDTNALRVYPTDTHPNRRGHAMIADNVYSKLRAQPAVWTALTGNEGAL